MDMSRFVDNWKVGEVTASGAPTEALLECPADKPVTVEIQISGAEPPERGKICVVQGVSGGYEELWAVRMDRTGRLFLHLGTMGRRETEDAYFPDFALAISYNPASGAISAAARVVGEDIPGQAPYGQILTAYADNSWARYVNRHGKAPRESWQLGLGCPQDGRADKPPLGWTISASFRLGEAVPVVDQVIQTRGGFAPGYDLGRNLLAETDDAEVEAACERMDRFHMQWEAMLALVQADAPYPNHAALAQQAGAIVDAHFQWRKDQGGAA